MTQQQSVISPESHFATIIYTIKKPEFLNDVNIVANDLLSFSKKQIPINETYPLVMTGTLIGSEQTKIFEKFIAESAWLILDSQGYNMDGLGAYVSEMFVQEHFKYSGMEQHVHPHGVVLSGFYFLTAPEDGCMIELHDPRAGKVQASLPIKNIATIKEANNSIFVKPETAMMIFSNSWLPHSFTRNSSNESVKFVHFNVSVKPIENQSQPIIV